MKREVVVNVALGTQVRVGMRENINTISKWSLIRRSNDGTVLRLWPGNAQSSEGLGVHIRIQTPHLVAMVQLKIDRLWMVSGEYGGLCEVVPTELYSLHCSGMTSVAENDEVCRKFKKRSNTEVRWWFLIRGDETVLQNLDQE